MQYMYNTSQAQYLSCLCSDLFTLYTLSLKHNMYLLVCAGVVIILPAHHEFLRCNKPLFVQ